MDVNSLLGLLIVSLVSSYIVSSTAVPTPRSFISTKEDPPSANLLAQDIIGSNNNDGKLLVEVVVGEYSENEKMEMVSTDYKVHTHHNQNRASGIEINKKKNGRKMIKDLQGGGEQDMKGRMDMEIMDYGHTGPNPRHDPTSPPHPSP